MSSRDALGAVFRACHAQLVRCAARVLGSQDRAEDIAQEAYAGLLSRTSTGSSIAQPRAYLFTAARHLAVDQLRRDRTEARVQPEDMALIADLAPDAEATAASRERLLLLAASLEELPPATREAFLLARLDGLPHREIAARLNVSVSMVEKHLMRALGHLRRSVLPEP